MPSGGPVPQVRLGAGLLGSANHGRVHRRGRGSQDVRQSRALLTRGVRGTGVLERIDDRGRRTHDEVLHHVDLLARTHRREQRVRLDTLQDHSAHTRHLRGRHRGAGHELVGTTRDRGIDVSAGGADLGLEAQVGSDTEGGEARHGVLRARGHNLTWGDTQATVGGGQHRLSISLRDERGGHAVGHQAHNNERITGNVVVDDEAGGLGCRDVIELVLEGEEASLDQNDLALETLGVRGLERGTVLRRANSAIDVLEGAPGHVGQVGHLLPLGAAGALVGNVAVSDGEGTVGQRVVDRSHGHDGGIRRGFAQDRGVGVRGVGQVLAG